MAKSLTHGLVLGWPLLLQLPHKLEYQRVVAGNVKHQVATNGD
jgi:hypothetical protein